MRGLLNRLSRGPKSSIPTPPGRPVPPGARVDPALDPAFGDPVVAAVREELREGVLTGLRAVMDRVRDPDDRAFFAERLAEWRGVPGWIGEWLRGDESSAAAHLIAGRHAIYWAWQARGSGAASAVEDESWRLFFGRLNMAEMLLKRAAELDPGDPTPWAFMVISARGLQTEKTEKRVRFEEAIKRAPHHRVAHSQMLQNLCKKWGGSHEAMFDFARAAAAKAPPDCALHTLIAEAHIERWLADDEATTRPGANYFTTPAVRNEIARAANAYFHGPAFTATIDSVRNRNYFAFCLWLAGEREAAAEQFRAIGGWVSEYPWCLVGDPVRIYAKAAGECGVAGVRKAA